MSNMIRQLLIRTLTVKIFITLSEETEQQQKKTLTGPIFGELPSNVYGNSCFTPGNENDANETADARVGSNLVIKVYNVSVGAVGGVGLTRGRTLGLFSTEGFFYH